MWRQNAHTIRKQSDRALPSGGRPDHFYNNPERYGGDNCLINVDLNEIDDLLADSEDGVSKLRYVDAEIEPLIKEAYLDVGSPNITLATAWAVFKQITLCMLGNNVADSP